MGALFLTLILLTSAAQAQEASGGLKCEADASNSKNPYAKMKKANEDSVRLSVTRLGITLGPVIPRIEMVKGLNKRLGELCAHKATLEARATELNGQTSEAEMVSTGPEGCEKYGQLSSKIGTFNNVNKQYQISLQRVLIEQKKNSEAKIAEDYKLFKPHWEKPGVIQSFRGTWGIIPSDNPNEKDRKTALISSRIIQIEEEQKLVADRQPGYEEFTKSLNNLKAKCPSLTEIDPMKASAQKPGDEWGTMAKKPGDPGYVAPVDNNNTTPYVAPTDTQQPATPEGPVKAENEEGWISRNKTPLMLGVGAAAVVGGVLWYKNKQDKEEDKTNDWINKQVKSATATSTVTSTSTSTGTATATKTLSVNGFPPSASTNYVLPTITASVSGANNDGIDISIACVSSCSLAGTLTKKTVDGKAEFTDLYFTAPHEGVQLRVSGTGLNSIASPGSFNVISSGRQ